MSEPAIELEEHLPVQAAPVPLPDVDGWSGRLVQLVDRPVLEWSADRRFRVTWAIGRSLLDGGLSPTDLVGMRVTDAFGRIDPAMTPVEAHARALEGEDVILRIRWGPRILEALVTPRRNRDGEAIGIVAEAYDVAGNAPTVVRGETDQAVHQPPRRGRIRAAAFRTS